MVCAALCTARILDVISGPLFSMRRQTERIGMLKFLEPRGPAACHQTKHKVLKGKQTQGKHITGSHHDQNLSCTAPLRFASSAKQTTTNHRSEVSHHGSCDSIVIMFLCGRGPSCGAQTWSHSQQRTSPVIWHVSQIDQSPRPKHSKQGSNPPKVNFTRSQCERFQAHSTHYCANTQGTGDTDSLVVKQQTHSTFKLFTRDSGHLWTNSLSDTIDPRFAPS